MTRHQIRAAILVVALLVISGWIIWSSETFQECKNSRENAAANQHTEEGVAKTFGLYKDPSGQFFDDNGEAVTAFSRKFWLYPPFCCGYPFALKAATWIAR
jgi:hypothetical protein